MPFQDDQAQLNAHNDWVSFVQYFASECKKYVEAGGKAFIGFWIPCECCSYEFGIAMQPTTGNHLIFANLDKPSEIRVDLLDGGETVVSYTVREHLPVIEEIFGSAVHPDPGTPLGLMMKESVCFYEHAAIRMIPFLATVLKIDSRQAADTYADWQMGFD